jgi:uncharacterized protein (DUF2249 family)
MSYAYTPLVGSTAYLVVEYFTTNPHEQLTTEQLSAKFGKASKQWHSLLSDAVRSGVLKREQNEDTELVYSLGKGCPSIKAAPERHPSARPDMLLAGAVVGMRKAQLPDLDLSTIQIRKGVPRPTQRGKELATPMRKLFEQLEVGDSFEVPADFKHSVKNLAARMKKQGRGTFSIHTVAAGVGVWRDS